MDERDWLKERFEANRGYLGAVAHRMLGSVAEADDAVPLLTASSEWRRAALPSPPRRWSSA